MTRLQEFEALVAGVPFVLYGRAWQPHIPPRERGLDCSGLSFAYLRFLGLQVKDWNSYQIHNDNRPRCEEILAVCCDPVAIADRIDGDILLFSKPGTFNLHFGIQVEPGVILHCSPLAEIVQRKSLDGEWPSLIVSVWRPRL